ncbi:MAG: hypothetical protein R6U95_00635 [Bacteroidales bacterium]
MKKLNVLFILGLIASIGFFTSCDDTEGDPIKPKIDILSGAENGEAVLNVGDELNIEFMVREGDNKLEDVVVKVGVGTIYTASDEDIKIEDKMTILLNTVMDEAGTKNLTITATDKEGLETEEKITVVVEAGDLSDKGTKILGASGNDDNGSYYSLEDNAVMDFDAATETTESPAKVTLVYNYDDTDGAQIYSPTESSGLSFDGSTATETRFSKLSGITFDSATGSDVPAAENITDTKLTGLATDDVIAFKTADGTLGLIEVVAIEEGADGSATIGIKTKIVQ